MQQKILLITTGGTILMTKNHKDVLSPVKSDETLFELVPNIKKLGAKIDVVSLMNIDSADMLISHWQIIGKSILENYDSYDGFVVIHGTDTMAYTASALSLMLKNIGKPVILTGSQVPLSEVGSDGHNNLINAIRFALEDIGEVAVLFGSRLIRGSKCTKISEFDLNSFETVNSPYLGKVGLDLKLKGINKKRCTKKIDFCSNFSDKVLIIKLFPNINISYLEKLFETNIKGVVIEGFGAGNIPHQNNGLLSLIEKLIKRKITVVISTQCIYGTAEYEKYAGGNKARGKGSLTSFDMSKEMAIVKLMWVLGQTDKQTEIKKLYYKNFCGEINHRYLY